MVEDRNISVQANLVQFISRDLFEELPANMRFSNQSSQHGELSSERYIRRLCEDFLQAFNKHRLERVALSHMICMDEFISRWYGVSETWLEYGLPFLVDIQRKTESGCVIHSAACSNSGIMIRLSFAKSAAERESIPNLS